MWFDLMILMTPIYDMLLFMKDMVVYYFKVVKYEAESRKTNRCGGGVLFCLLFVKYDNLFSPFWISWLSYHSVCRVWIKFISLFCPDFSWKMFANCGWSLKIWKCFQNGCLFPSSACLCLLTYSTILFGQLGDWLEVFNVYLLSLELKIATSVWVI